MTKLDDFNFKQFIREGEKTVIFTAGYCGACRKALKELETSSQSGIIEMTDPRTIGTRIQVKVKRVPTVITYKDGKEIKRAEGTTALLDIARTRRERP